MNHTNRISNAKLNHEILHPNLLYRYPARRVPGILLASCIMRSNNPESSKDFWLSRFLRVVLSRQPSLRWSLDYSRVDQLYLTCPDPIQAGLDYLKG